MAATQRRTGRRVKDVQFGSFSSLIGETNGGAGPEVWFPFTEASGTITQTLGSDVVALDMDASHAGPVAYAQDAPVAAASSIALGALGNELLTASTEDLGSVNSGSPAATGTMLWVWRENWIVGANSEMFHNGGLNTGNQRLYFTDDGGMTFLTQETTSGGTYTYSAVFSAADQATHSSHVRNGDWHMFAVVQTATEKLYYLDGTVITPTTENVGVNTDKLMWMPDIDAGGVLSFGSNPTLPGVWYFFGHIDEFVFWDGYEVTALEITNIWSRISSGTSVNGAREGMLYVLWDMESGLPAHVYDAKNEFLTQATDRGSAATPTAVPTANGAPVYLQPGITDDGTSHLHAATTYLNGDALRHTNPELADLASMATGYILLHWKPGPDMETNGWTPAILSIETDEDSATEAGAIRLHMLQDGRPFLQIMQDDNVNWDYQASCSPTGAHITDDEVWQQLLIFQPADGNGVRMLHNGEFHDFGDCTHTPGAGVGDDIDAWFASASDNWGTSSKFGIGGLINNPNSVNAMEGNMGLVCIGDKSAWSTAELARIFAASGITA